MASEDSDHFTPRNSAIHHFGDFKDLDQALAGEMSILLHRLDAPCELLESLRFAVRNGYRRKNGMMVSRSSWRLSTE